MEQQRPAGARSPASPYPRVTMLETEYLHAVIQAEIQWVDSVLAGLRDGSITWSPRELREAASQLDD